MNMTVQLDSNLLWAAQSVFLDPDQGWPTHASADILYLLDWAEPQGISGVKDLKAVISDGALDTEPLIIDYTRLFVNSFPTAKAHPFAGWYRNEGIVFGSEERRVRRFYARYGVELQDDQALPADHILVELEFTARLLEEYQRTGDERYYQALVQMIEQHLQIWIWDFLHTMETEAQSNYYRTMARVLNCLFHHLILELKGVA